MLVGADGYHGVSRPMVGTRSEVFVRDYPFAWLGVLAGVAPSCDELIYSRHQRGFALHSLRSPTVSRLYLQCRPDEDLDEWPDARIWDELQTRLGVEGWTLHEGPITEKGVTPMRSVVAEPMRHGRLLLAGDAGHIVPPTGAKGLNLAIADVAILAPRVVDFVRNGSHDRYRRLLRRRAATRVAGAGLLQRHDVDDARATLIRSRTSDNSPRLALRRDLGGGTAQPRGELCRPAAPVTRSGRAPAARPSRARRHRVGRGCAVAVVVVSLNLRPAVASVGPVLNEIRRDLGLSSTAAAVLTSAPVFCFGALAMLGPWLAAPARAAARRPRPDGGNRRRAGAADRTRRATLFAGTLLAAAGIAAANVLMPVIIKRDFAESTGLMMGLYTTALVGVRGSCRRADRADRECGRPWLARRLGIWAVVAAAVGGGVVGALRGAGPPDRGRARRVMPAQLRRDRLAWMVTVYFGLQSLGFYAVLELVAVAVSGPRIFGCRAPAVCCRSAPSVQLPVALALPTLATRLVRQDGLVVSCGRADRGRIPRHPRLPRRPAPRCGWSMLGIGQGAAFAIALSLLVLRTRTHASTAQLSGMAQSVGYLIAGVGPARRSVRCMRPVAAGSSPIVLPARPPRAAGRGRPPRRCARIRPGDGDVMTSNDRKAMA